MLHESQKFTFELSNRNCDKTYSLVIPDHTAIPVSPGSNVNKTELIESSEGFSLVFDNNTPILNLFFTDDYYLNQGDPTVVAWLDSSDAPRVYQFTYENFRFSVEVITNSEIAEGVIVVVGTVDISSDK